MSNRFLTSQALVDHLKQDPRLFFRPKAPRTKSMTVSQAPLTEGNPGCLQRQSFLNSLEQGGLGQILSSQGGSRIAFALDCLKSDLARHLESPPLAFWASDKGTLSPLHLQHLGWRHLSRFVVAQPPSALEVWKVGLDAVQRGLFDWIFLKPSNVCSESALRRLQLSVKKHPTRVVLLPPRPLAHWPIKISVDIGGLQHAPAHTLLSKLSGSDTSCGGLLCADAPSFSTQKKGALS